MRKLNVSATLQKLIQANAENLDQNLSLTTLSIRLFLHSMDITYLFAAKCFRKKNVSNLLPPNKKKILLWRNKKRTAYSRGQRHPGI